jgi:nitroreductase
MPGCIEFDLKPRELVALIRNRRSIRQYEPKPVYQETISQLIRLVSYAPTGHNRQKVEWIVVSGSKEVKRITSLVIGWLKAVCVTDAQLYSTINGYDVITAWEKGSDPILHNAPHLIIALGPRHTDLAYIDSIIALSYIELLAPFFGLGSCWLGSLLRALQGYTPLIEAMQIPADKKAHGALMIGYAKGYYMRWPSRRPPVIKWKQ